MSLAEGDAALRRGELDDAQVKYLVALNAEPESPEILYRIGTIYDSQGKTALAEESFQQALRLDNKHTNSKEALGLLLLKSGRYEDAHKLLKEVVVEDRNRWRSLNGLGVIYDMQKLHEQAQTFYRMALRLNSRSAQLQNNLGYSRYLSGHWEDAELYFRAAVNLQPGYKQAWSNLGLYYVRIGNFDAALEAFEQISEPHQAANNVGYLSMLQDNFETAEKYFEMAIRESPVYYQIAHDNLQRVRNQQK
ncbi:MAG: tetratricopeptide repeat protein [Gammaproteobacteria bacterium]|nr:tetratricopeptide repeat protein [Gammaproteobacteria bacterium]